LPEWRYQRLFAETDCFSDRFYSHGVALAGRFDAVEAKSCGQQRPEFGSPSDI
jgi:hypothetical protein